MRPMVNLEEQEFTAQVRKSLGRTTKDLTTLFVYKAKAVYKVYHLTSRQKFTSSRAPNLSIKTLQSQYICN